MTLLSRARPALLAALVTLGTLAGCSAPERKADPERVKEEREKLQKARQQEWKTTRPQ